MEGLYYHFSLSECVCVCLSVCLLFSCEQNSSRTDEPIWTVFTKWLLIALAEALLQLVTLGQRSRSQWRYILFSSQFSFNFPTLYLSSLCSIKIKFGMSLRYDHGQIYKIESLNLCFVFWTFVTLNLILDQSQVCFFVRRDLASPIQVNNLTQKITLLANHRPIWQSSSKSIHE